MILKPLRNANCCKGLAGAVIGLALAAVLAGCGGAKVSPDPKHPVRAAPSAADAAQSLEAECTQRWNEGSYAPYNSLIAFVDPEVRITRETDGCVITATSPGKEVSYFAKDRDPYAFQEFTGGGAFYREQTPQVNATLIEDGALAYTPASPGQQDPSGSNNEQGSAAPNPKPATAPCDNPGITIKSGDTSCAEAERVFNDLFTAATAAGPTASDGVLVDSWKCFPARELDTSTPCISAAGSGGSTIELAPGE